MTIISPDDLNFHQLSTMDRGGCHGTLRWPRLLAAGWSQMRRAAFERMEVEVNPLTRRSWNCWWKKSSSGVCTVKTRLVRCNWTYNFTQFSGVPQQMGDVFHTAVFTLQVRYVRPTSHGKAWIPVAKLCPWILGHLDGRAPPSGESIAEILRNQARLKLCTSKVASAAINSDWGDVSREVEDSLHQGMRISMSTTRNQLLSRMMIQVSCISVQTCTRLSTPSQLEYPTFRQRNWHKMVPWVDRWRTIGKPNPSCTGRLDAKKACTGAYFDGCCSQHGADINSSFFHPGNFVGGFRSWLATVQRSG